MYPKEPIVLSSKNLVLLPLRYYAFCLQQMVPWWRWFYYINPISWTLYAIIVTQLGDDTHVVRPQASSLSSLVSTALPDMLTWHER